MIAYYCSAIIANNNEIIVIRFADFKISAMIAATAAAATVGAVLVIGPGGAAAAGPGYALAASDSRCTPGRRG